MRRVTRGSSPGLGAKTLLCLEEDEETLRGSFVLRALNAFLGAGTMVVVLLGEEITNAQWVFYKSDNERAYPSSNHPFTERAKCRAWESS